MIIAYIVYRYYVLFSHNNSKTAARYFGLFFFALTINMAIVSIFSWSFDLIPSIEAGMFLLTITMFAFHKYTIIEYLDRSRVTFITYSTKKRTFIDIIIIVSILIIFIAATFSSRKQKALVMEHLFG